jgi:hypothetical protein
MASRKGAKLEKKKKKKKKKKIGARETREWTRKEIQE